MALPEAPTYKKDVIFFRILFIIFTPMKMQQGNLVKSKVNNNKLHVLFLLSSIKLELAISVALYLSSYVGRK